MKRQVAMCDNKCLQIRHLPGSVEGGVKLPIKWILFWHLFLGSKCSSQRVLYPFLQAFLISDAFVNFCRTCRTAFAGSGSCTRAKSKRVSPRDGWSQMMRS